MIRKCATVPGFRVALGLILATILAGATSLHAQETPASQPPAQQPPAQQPSAQPSQQSSTQEASPEESMPGRKPKVKDFKNWAFNVGAGASLTNGTTKNFVRGGGGVVAAGAARNYSKYFGFRLDFQFDNCSLVSRVLCHRWQETWLDFRLHPLCPLLKCVLSEHDANHSSIILYAN